jgi:hypothetical protein
LTGRGLDCIVNRASQDGYDVERGSGHEIDPGYWDGATDAASVNPGPTNLTALLWSSVDDAKTAATNYESYGGFVRRRGNVVLAWVSQPAAAIVERYEGCVT